jgi:ADP-heptose:LPS heptosyltransferase
MRGPDSLLILRPDRLGDVIVSTPVHRMLREAYPQARIIWLVQDWIAPLIEDLPGMNGVIRYQPKGRHAGWAGLRRLVDDIKVIGAQASVALQSDARVSAAVLAAGVPWRVGPYSKMHSVFLYNHGLRQRRSESVRHEAEYGLELLGALPGWNQFADAGARAAGPEVAVDPDALVWAREWLVQRGLSGTRCVGVHPGMGGSALNWPRERYVELVRALVARGVPVILTCGQGEGSVAQEIAAASGSGGGDGVACVHVCSAERDGMTLPRLAALQSLFSVFVAPSTGPLHLASAVKTRVVSVYPPIRVQHPDRWGPYVGTEYARVLTPVSREICGERFKCRGAACSQFPCMEKVEASQVLAAIEGWL